MEFPRQEHWSGVPFPPPGDPPDAGIEPTSLAWAGGFFTNEPPGKPLQQMATRSALLSPGFSGMRWRLRHQLHGMDLVKGSLLWLSTWSGYALALLYLCIVERYRDSAG